MHVWSNSAMSERVRMSVDGSVKTRLSVGLLRNRFCDSQPVVSISSIGRYSAL